MPVQQRPNLPSVWRLSQLRRYQDCRHEREIGFSTADLGTQRKFPAIRYSFFLLFFFGASHGFVDILFSGRLSFLYSNHLEGRQTEENHFVHICTNSYRRTHVMTSQFHLSAFFCGFYFRGSRSVRENRENLHPAKISRYTVAL